MVRTKGDMVRTGRATGDIYWVYEWCGVEFALVVTEGPSLSLNSEVVLKKFPSQTRTHPHSQRNFVQPDAGMLVHHYLEGKFGVEVHCRSGNEIADLESSNFALVFENVSADKVAVFDSHSQGTSNGQTPPGQRCTNQVQLSMAVNAGPVVQNDESRTNVELIPLEGAGQSRVTLYSLNDGSYVRRHIFHSPNRLSEVCGVRGDWELPLLCIGGRIASEFQNGGVINAGIQSAPELIQHLSEFEREWESPIPFDWFDKKSPSPIVIYLSPRSVNLTCVKSVPALYAGLAVNLCPVNTVPTHLEWRRHISSYRPVAW